MSQDMVWMAHSADIDEERFDRDREKAIRRVCRVIMAALAFVFAGFFAESWSSRTFLICPKLRLLDEEFL